MSSRVPLQPMNTAAQRRKPRVCTREACETCREKKAKCDGEQPCSRCEARGLECVYQIRNHRSKRSLRNELNALKERQRLQENLLAALQDPNRKETALQLLETEDPLAGAAKLWLKDDVDFEAASRIPDALSGRFDDDGLRSTSGSASPFPESSTTVAPQQGFATSPIASTMSPHRTNSIMATMQGGVDDFSAMAHGAYGMGGGAPFQHFPPAFTPAKVGPSIGGLPFQSQPGGPAPGVFGLAPQQPMPWLDPSLSGGNMPYPQQQQQQQHNHPFQPIPGGNMEDWAGSGPGNVRGPMMSQDQPTHVAQQTTDSDALDFGQWTSPTADARRLSESASPPKISMPGTRTAFAPPGASSHASAPTKAPTRQERASISSTASNGHPRSQSRERHRLASARNWHKQKQATADLQATKVRVEAQHAALKEEYAEVLDQVQQVKHALLGHAGCNDPAIKMWLQREATGVLSGFHNPTPDDNAGAADGETAEALYPTPTSEDQRGRKEVLAEGDDMMMGGVEVNVTA